MRLFVSILAAVLAIAASASGAESDAEMAAIEDRWAAAKYEMTDKAQRMAEVAALHRDTAAIAVRHPGRAEPLIWQALIFILEAQVHSNTSSLGMVRSARRLLEESLALDPRAMAGAAHANLGSLYYEVPGWPLSFGDNEKAAKHLRTALDIDPDGRDANYFYGDFLLQRKRAADALPYLEKALAVPHDTAHVRADRGRHAEVVEAYEKARRALTRR